MSLRGWGGYFPGGLDDDKLQLLQATYRACEGDMTCAIADAKCVDATRNAACASTVQETVPVCDGEADCEAKWNAAQLWVAKNAGYKIQIATEVLIETYNSTAGGSGLAASVTKEPIGDGRFAIIANLSGGSLAQFEGALYFNASVSAAAP